MGSNSIITAVHTGFNLATCQSIDTKERHWSGAGEGANSSEMRSLGVSQTVLFVGAPIFHSCSLGSKRDGVNGGSYQNVLSIWVCLFCVADANVVFPMHHKLIGCWTVLWLVLSPWLCGCGDIEHTIAIALLLSLASSCWECIGYGLHTML